MLIVNVIKKYIASSQGWCKRLILIKKEKDVEDNLIPPTPTPPPHILKMKSNDIDTYFKK